MTTTETAGPGPGYKSHPEHKVALAREGRRIRVTLGGETIAETTNAVTIHEADYPPVQYIPREDVRTETMTPTDNSTHCPFKGDASYWSISAGGKTAENAVWSYERPFDEVAEIKDYMAFYPKRVDAIEVQDA